MLDPSIGHVAGTHTASEAAVAFGRINAVDLVGHVKGERSQRRSFRAWGCREQSDIKALFKLSPKS